MKEEDLYLIDGYEYSTEQRGDLIVYVLKDKEGNIVYVGTKEGIKHYSTMLRHSGKREALREDYNHTMKDNKKIRDTKIKNLVISSGAVLVLSVPFIVSGSMALISLPVIGTATFLFGQKILDAKYYYNRAELRNYAALLEEETEAIKSLEDKVEEHSYDKIYKKVR